MSSSLEFIHSINNYFLSTCYVSNIVLGTGYPVVRKINSCLIEEQMLSLSCKWLSSMNKILSINMLYLIEMKAINLFSKEYKSISFIYFKAYIFSYLRKLKLLDYLPQY